MSSYNKVYVDVNVTDKDMVAAIIDYGREIDGNTSPTWDWYCFRKWSDRTKWDFTPLVTELSRRFSTAIFSISYGGDWGAGKVFVHNGEEINETEIYPARPAYPPLPMLRQAIHTAQKLRVEEQLAREKEAAQKLLADKQKRVQELESELEKIKAELKPIAPPTEWGG